LVCVGEKNAHGAGEPIRTLALFHDEDKRLTVVTGGGDGYVRRWSLFATEDGDTDSGAAVRSVGATRVSGNEPISASCFGFESAVGSKTTVRAVSIDANGVAAAVTSSGDLWIEQVWKEEVVDTNDTREGVATHARQSRVGDETEEHEEDADGKNEQDATPGSPEPTKSEPTKSKSGVFACFSRGQPSAAHCVAWHPNDTRGLFAVAGGGSRVVVYSAKQKKTIAVVWAVDPAPAKITSLAFAPDPAPEKFPEQYDTEEKGGLLLALGTADGFVRLVRLRLDTVGTATGNTDDAKTTGTTDPLAEKISSQTHVSYAARTVACVRSSPSGSAVTSLVFSPNGSRVAAAAEHLVVLHRVVGVSAGGAQGTQDGWFPHKTVCKGHRSSIQSVDWSVDGTVIRTTCRAREILHFETTQGRQGTCWGFPKSASLFCRSSARNYGSLHKSQVDNFPIHGTCTLKTDTFRVTTQAFGDFRDAEWHAWTAPLGFPVMGLFPCGITPTTQMGGDEINSVDRCDVSRGDGSMTHESMTHDNTDSLSLVATGDDFGRVRLFKYPCVVSNDRNARTEMFAHAQHVSCVRFAPELVEAVSTDTNSRLLVSTGGADRAALQWVVTSASREGDDSDEVGGGITTADSAMVAEIEPSTSTSQSNHQPPAQKTGLYRQSKLKELESRVSDLLNAARPKPPQRRLKPWLAKPAIAVRSVDSSRIPTGPRRPDTPPDNGEVLAFKDGEFYWQTPPSPRDFAKEFRK
jgi:WD40 repeat protein